MTDAEFEEACVEVARLADLIAEGTPKQIRTYAEDGWWTALETLRQVYNDWLMDRPQ